MTISIEIPDNTIKALFPDIKSPAELFDLTRYNIEYLSRHNKNLTKAQQFIVADLYTIFENMEVTNE